MDGIPIHKRMRFKKGAIWAGERQMSTRSARRQVREPERRRKTHRSRHRRDERQLEFLGYFLSRGRFSGTLRPGCPTAQSYRRRPLSRPRRSGSASNGCRSGSPTTAETSINAKRLRHLAPFGKCHEKYVPGCANVYPGADRDTPRRAHARGWLRQQTTGVSIYTTSSKRLADDVTELLLKKDGRERSSHAGGRDDHRNPGAEPRRATTSSR